MGVGRGGRVPGANYRRVPRGMPTEDEGTRTRSGFESEDMGSDSCDSSDAISGQNDGAKKRFKEDFDCALRKDCETPKRLRDFAGPFGVAKAIAFTQAQSSTILSQKRSEKFVHLYKHSALSCVPGTSNELCTRLCNWQFGSSAVRHVVTPNALPQIDVQSTHTDTSAALLQHLSARNHKEGETFKDRTRASDRATETGVSMQSRLSS